MIDAAFKKTASRDPEKVAVAGWDDKLTYAELDHRADALAERLHQAGVTPGSVVGVYLERSAATITCLLAILRMGAAYMALDDRQPAERRRFLLRDAGVRVVVTRPGAELPDGCTPVFPSERMSEGARRFEAPSVGPEYPAYLAYTSGSTGRPKGVCVPHRAVIRLAFGADYLQVSPDDVFAHYAPLAFDASTLEIWTPLLRGMRLAVPPPGDSTPAQLAAFVRQAGVSVLWLTAGLFHEVIDVGLGDLTGLRYLLAGGDVLSAAHVNRALTALPGCVLINGYGPTENTTFTCCHQITSTVRSRSVPIGRPIQGTTVYVLDERLRPVPPGEIGELYTGGLGVAHGYFGDTALTARRFVPDPFASQPGARMYRTGDLVRRGESQLEYISRTDRQLKINGFRVELGEVESVLAGLPGVDQAAVVSRRDQRGGARMAAFVTGKASTIDVRRRLSHLLPSYAVPAYITVLDSLPLTANGKVDRAELESRRTLERPELSSEYRSPATALERTLTQLWADYLGLDRVGAHDDFFELGGHSLLAVRILREAEREYGVEISPLDFYLDLTPAGLARTIESASGAPG